ncbi:hypothetical protein [Alkalimarinus coralli]|uniref:hypothetical protein n=1 Tax=Alkalimarinus coralli TaxID=2935863 RepID=UPI00202B2588|nr:hypothetical protein [Alkalimarinus coralli]
MDDIPLLKDIVTDNQTTTSQVSKSTPEKDSETAFSPPNTRSEGKENPFLPYEHLAKLALEREQFTQSLEAFTENLKHEQPYRERTPKAQRPLTSNSNDVIVRTITSNIIKQLRPIIEEKVASELERYFEDTSEGA